MEENETVTDVTDETPESESNFPYGPVVFLALAAGATSAAVTAKIMKLRQAKKKAQESDVVTGEVVDSTPPAPPAES